MRVGAHQLYRVATFGLKIKFPVFFLYSRPISLCFFQYICNVLFYKWSPSPTKFLVFSLSGKVNIKIPCFPCAVATLPTHYGIKELATGPLFQVGNGKKEVLMQTYVMNCTNIAVYLMQVVLTILFLQGPC